MLQGLCIGSSWQRKRLSGPNNTLPEGVTRFEWYLPAGNLPEVMEEWAPGEMLP